MINVQAKVYQEDGYQILSIFVDGLRHEIALLPQYPTLVALIRQLREMEHALLENPANKGK